MTCTVSRLMRRMRLRSLGDLIRGKTGEANQPDTSFPTGLVDRQFTVTAPNRLWVAGLTYARSWVGMVCAAFILGSFSRRILGWQTSTSLSTGLALDALEMALWTRRKEEVTIVIHHPDRNLQYLSICSTERLADASAITSVESHGDSCDSALAESIVGLHKTELTRKKGP